ncbi:MAG: hypothetical protein HYU69_02430 [Bacteroidetes bacterium]|nr:hypothetical protein [Bacteroidota bacterium]
MNNVLVVTYWSYKDALIQTYTLPYLRIIRSKLPPGAKIYLVTFESSIHQITVPEKQKIKEELSEEGIYLLSHSYINFGIKAFIQIIPITLSLLWISLFKKISTIHCFCTPAGAIGYLLSVISRKQLVIDSYEPHAEAMVENGTWKKNSLQHKVLFFFEKCQTKRARYIIGTTPGMRNYGQNKYGVVIKNFFTKPACIDFGLFDHDKLISKREEIRNKLGLTGKVVGIYAGKIGGIYLEREIFEIIKTAQDHWGDKFRMILLTSAPEPLVKNYIRELSINSSSITIKFVDHEQIPSYLSVADFAINPVKPVPTKRFCTSIKDGEYWAMGLPVIIPDNISNDSEIIKKHKIGAVLSQLNQEEYKTAIREIDQLIHNTSGSNLQRKIIDVANHYRNFNIANSIYSVIYRSETARNKIIIFLYNSLFDPLIQSNIYLYIRAISQTLPDKYEFTFITYEEKNQVDFYTSEHNQEILNELTLLNIHWISLKWRPGLNIVNKFLDLISPLPALIMLKSNNYNSIVSLASVSGSFAYLYSAVLGFNHYLYQFEPHSDFEVDANRYKHSSLQYKTLNMLEKKSVKKAKVISTGTNAMIQTLSQWGAKGMIYKIPSVVNENKFNFSNAERSLIRNELNIPENATVVLYTGKFGGLYYKEEIIEFLGELLKLNPLYYILIVTPNDKKELEYLCIKHKISSNNLTITGSTHDAIHKYYFAADIGIVGIPSTPSQIYRSPIKTGEYLASGIPYIVCRGVSDDDLYAERYKIGVVVEGMSASSANYVHPKIMDILSENKEQLRMRCRKYGIEYRGFSVLYPTFVKALNSLIDDKIFLK